MSKVKNILDFADKQTAGQPFDSAIKVIWEMNIAMQVAAGALELLKDREFDGKWRIRRALQALSIRDQHRADLALKGMVKRKRKRKAS